MKNKSIVSIVLTGILAVSVLDCGSAKETGGKVSSEDDKTITIGSLLYHIKELWI